MIPKTKVDSRLETYEEKLDDISGSGRDWYFISVRFSCQCRFKVSRVHG